jgi:hypothetical protein
MTMPQPEGMTGPIFGGAFNRQGIAQGLAKVEGGLDTIIANASGSRKR